MQAGTLVSSTGTRRPAVGRRRRLGGFGVLQPEPVPQPAAGAREDHSRSVLCMLIWCEDQVFEDCLCAFFKSPNGWIWGSGMQM